METQYICPICDKNFEITNKQMLKIKQNNDYIPCCSQSCASKFGFNKSSKYTKRKELIESIKNKVFLCKNCGKEFHLSNRQVTTYYLDNSYTPCCSFSCSSSYSRQFVNYEESNRKNKETRITKNGKYASDYQLEKNKNTLLNKYGVTNAFLIPESIEKIKQTKLDRYGDETYTNREKATNTMKEKYGYNSPLDLKSVRQLGIIKRYEKYDSKFKFFKKVSNDRILKFKNKYGTLYPLQVKEILEKAIDTKRRHGNLGNTSSHEEYIAQKLSEKFNSYKEDFSIKNMYRQYKSKDYPFLCDFYIPEIDTYIEYHGSWVHGNKRFTNSCEDLQLIENWKNKYNSIIYINNSKRSNPGSQYLFAIKCFTEIDPNKLNIAKQNNLRYLTFYTLKEFNNWFSNINNKEEIINENS